MKNVRSPIRYPGGKYRLLKEIFSFAPENYDEYREPFVGGAHALIHSLKKNPDIKHSASDVFEPLVNFYQHLKDDTDMLIKTIISLKEHYLNNERELFRFCKKYVLDENIDSLSRAAYFYILNRVTFSGLTLSGGYSAKANRFKYTHIESTRQTGKFFKDVEFFNTDYSTLLNKPSNNSNCWIYCDPPYAIDSTTLYGKNGKLHSDFDHERFADECKKCQHKLLVTYDDNDFIRELFDWANIEKVPVQYNMNNTKNGSSKKRFELFITNY